MTSLDTTIVNSQTLRDLQHVLQSAQEAMRNEKEVLN